MSVARDRAITARTKFADAERLLREACDELAGALPEGHDARESARALLPPLAVAREKLRLALTRIPP